MNGRHVDPVEGARFLRQLLDDGLSLPDVTGPAHLFKVWSRLFDMVVIYDGDKR